MRKYTNSPIKRLQSPHRGFESIGSNRHDLQHIAKSWSDRPLRQATRKHFTKNLVSVTPKIKIGVLWKRSRAALQVSVTRVFVVVPSGIPFRGLDMSLADMHLVPVSERADLDGSEQLALGMSDPLRLFGASGMNVTATMSPHFRVIRVAWWAQAACALETSVT